MLGAIPIALEKKSSCWQDGSSVSGLGKFSFMNSTERDEVIMDSVLDVFIQHSTSGVGKIFEFPERCMYFGFRLTWCFWEG